jgi:hypothetical protein
MNLYFRWHTVIECSFVAFSGSYAPGSGYISYSVLIKGATTTEGDSALYKVSIIIHATKEVHVTEFGIILPYFLGYTPTHEWALTCCIDTPACMEACSYRIA